jgi:hypothetical protein
MAPPPPTSSYTRVVIVGLASILGLVIGVVLSIFANALMFALGAAGNPHASSDADASSQLALGVVVAAVAGFAAWVRTKPDDGRDRSKTLGL